MAMWVLESRRVGARYKYCSSPAVGSSDPQPASEVCFDILSGTVNCANVWDIALYIAYRYSLPTTHSHAASTNLHPHLYTAAIAPTPMSGPSEETPSSEPGVDLAVSLHSRHCSYI